MEKAVDVPREGFVVVFPYGATTTSPWGVAAYGKDGKAVGGWKVLNLRIVEGVIVTNKNKITRGMALIITPPPGVKEIKLWVGKEELWFEVEE